MTAAKQWKRFKVPDAVRYQILADGSCTYCGEASDVVDHDIPVSKGGTNDADNLLPACWSCNERKGTQTATEYRSWLASRSPDNINVNEAELTAIAVETITCLARLDRKIKQDYINAGLIVKAMRDRGWSWHRIAMQTGIPQRTAGRWMKLAIDHRTQEGGIDERPTAGALREALRPVTTTEGPGRGEGR